MAASSNARPKALIGVALSLLVIGTLGLFAALYLVLRPPAHIRAGHAAASQVERGRITGMAELEHRFGPPYGRGFAGWDHAFHLGDVGSYFAIDSSWLVVRVDPASGRVIEARVIVD
ncbi:MAG: hypothetical protein ACIAS6_11770 [Phycisphaerales bacterium JB060]